MLDDVHIVTDAEEMESLYMKASPDCYILHRHSRRYPFHRQRGRYKDLKEALSYIANHDAWFSDIKM